MPRKGSIFEEVYVSSVKDKWLRAFWLTNKILKIKILIIIQRFIPVKLDEYYFVLWKKFPLSQF
jgi:hypothetical protein